MERRATSGPMTDDDPLDQSSRAALEAIIGRLRRASERNVADAAAFILLRARGYSRQEIIQARGWTAEHYRLIWLKVREVTRPGADVADDDQP